MKRRTKGSRGSMHAPVGSLIVRTGREGRTLFALAPPTRSTSASVWMSMAPAGWRPEEDENLGQVGQWRRCRGVPGDLVDLLIRLVRGSAAARDAGVES